MDFLSFDRTLTISFIEMRAQEIKVQPVINVVLEPESEMIDEVVVTGPFLALRQPLPDRAEVQQPRHSRHCQQRYRYVASGCPPVHFFRSGGAEAGQEAVKEPVGRFMDAGSRLRAARPAVHLGWR